MGKRTHTPAIGDFFHATILIGDKKKAFNGEQDFQSPPQPLSGEAILHKMDNICNHGKRRRLVKISLKAMLHVVGRRSPYSLILSIGDIYMFVITWM